MVKVVILLNRAEGYSHDEFVRRLREDHVPLAKDLPGLERYSTAIPADPETASVDGISELYFAADQPVGEAFGSPIGQRVQADAAEFMDVDANETLVLDEQVHIDR